MPTRSPRALTVPATWPYYCHVRRTTSIRILVTPEEKDRIEKGASRARRTVSDWLRLLAENEVERQSRSANVPGMFQEASAPPEEGEEDLS